MCGRYAFYQRASEVRQQLEASHMPVEECPDDDQCRQTYNFPPGAFGIVYRADVPDYGAGPSKKKKADVEDQAEPDEGVDTTSKNSTTLSKSEATTYKLQCMKWGLIPSWTKRSPDYGSMMKTINCRDDSLLENKGLWNAPKRRKRCIVLCQGFYEWLKKNNGKEKIPHYIKRKDGQLFCFAGLWDCVKYEDSDEKHYTYTVITTDSNKQMSFLHDRMPVVLENGSDAVRTWLDPGRYEWTKELQSLMKPFEGELEIFPVNKDVGKVGNNSPSFIIPIDSAANKSNIANFFGNQKKLAKDAEVMSSTMKAEDDIKAKGIKTEHEPEETRDTTKHENTESNAPLPSSPRGIKREFEDVADDYSRSPEKKATKLSQDDSQVVVPPSKPALNMKSATTNSANSKAASPTKAQKAAQGTPKITKFFGK